MQLISSQQNLYTKVLHTKKPFFNCDLWKNEFLKINLSDNLLGSFLLIGKRHRAKANENVGCKYKFSWGCKNGLK